MGAAHPAAEPLSPPFSTCSESPLWSLGLPRRPRVFRSPCSPPCPATKSPRKETFCFTTRSSKWKQTYMIRMTRTMRRKETWNRTSASYLDAVIRSNKLRDPDHAGSFDTDQCSVAVPKNQWQPDAQRRTCSRCLTRFRPWLRRHHCRACGSLFCGACTAGELPLVQAAEPDTEGCVIPLEVKEARSCDDCRARGLATFLRVQFSSPTAALFVLWQWRLPRQHSAALPLDVIALVLSVVSR